MNNKTSTLINQLTDEPTEYHIPVLLNEVIEGLAIKIGCDDETIGLWAKKHEEFSATIKELKMQQKNL